MHSTPDDSRSADSSAPQPLNGNVAKEEGNGGKDRAAKRAAAGIFVAGGQEFCKQTQLGNAKRFVLRHGDKVKYCPALRQWFVYDGSRWVPDQKLEVHRLAKETVLSIYAEAVLCEDEGSQTRREIWARECQTAYSIDSILNLARSEPEITISAEEFDSDPQLLNTINVTIDLRTGQAREHRRGDLITKVAPVTYDPKAVCPRFMAFQQRITGNDDELIAYKQRCVGSALTGVVEKQSVFIYHGSGNNGKTTELEVYRALVGDYGGQVRIESLMEQQRRSDGSGATPDIADLRGKRFVTSSEPAQGARLNESTVKYISSMGRIKARHLHREHIEFPHTWKIFIDTNHLPEIRGGDSAIWNRIGLVPFRVAIPKAEIDRDLPAKLEQELPGILNWAIAGCLEWRSAGLRPPTTVTEATEEYRSDSDQVGRFLSEGCVNDPSASEKARDLYWGYRTWAVGQGEELLSQNAFGRVMTAKKIDTKHTRDGNRYLGIRLKEGAKAGSEVDPSVFDGVEPVGGDV